MRIRSRRFAIETGLALLGVALFCGYAMAPSLTFLPYVALVPWTVLYMDQKRPRVSPLYFLAAGYLCWILCYKTTFQFGWFVPPAMALFFLPAWLLFPLLARRVQRLSLPRSITLPVLWVAFEWARLLLATGHFDLFALGYSQARLTPLVQIADVTGVYGISFLVAAVNGLLADALFVLKDAAWRPRILVRERRVLRPAAAIASAFALVTGYGSLRLTKAEETPGPRLAIVQQDDESVVPGSADLLVWPENAIRDDIDREGALFHDVASLAARRHAAILLVGKTTRSAFFVDAAGRLTGRYDKQILFPFSEYVPLDRIVGRVGIPAQTTYHAAIRKVFGSLPTGTRGTHMTLFALPWSDGTLRFATLIGDESAYPPLVAEAGRRGARFLVSLTSDGAIEGAFREQLLRVSMLRAIENRIAHVRAGHAGFSFIDPEGRPSAATRADTVALSAGGATAYAVSHDAFALSCVALSLWLLARAILRGGPVMTPHPVPAAATVAIVLALPGLD